MVEPRDDDKVLLAYLTELFGLTLVLILVQSKSLKEIKAITTKMMMMFISFEIYS